MIRIFLRQNACFFSFAALALGLEFVPTPRPYTAGWVLANVAALLMTIGFGRLLDLCRERLAQMPAVLHPLAPR